MTTSYSSVLPRRTPVRDWLIVLLLLGVLAPLALLSVAQRPPAPVAAAKQPAAQTAMAEPPAPPPQTAFDREALMTPGALISRWEPLVTEASKRFQVSPDWIRAVIRMESGGRTMMGEDQPITSDMGAMGIMQVLPQTYADMRMAYRLGDDPYDPHDNVIAGTAYLKWLYGKYGNPGMFAAYNDGPGNLEAFFNQGRALPDETHHYVDGISKILGTPASQFSSLATLHFTRPDGTSFELDARTVTAIRAAFPGEYAPGVASVLTIGKKQQGIKEDTDTAAIALRARGAKL
jgi:soluble lytic murein transglycosylase-like protein